jgi:hypothetical protein
MRKWIFVTKKREKSLNRVQNSFPLNRPFGYLTFVILRWFKKKDNLPIYQALLKCFGQKTDYFGTCNLFLQTALWPSLVWVHFVTKKRLNIRNPLQISYFRFSYCFTFLDPIKLISAQEDLKILQRKMPFLLWYQNSLAKMNSVVRYCHIDNPKNPKIDSP